MAMLSVDSATDAVRAAGRKAAAAAARGAAALADQSHQLQTRASEVVDETGRAAARIATHTVRRAEDARDRTGRRIKHAPFIAVAIACGAGMLAGIAMTWWVTRSRTERPGPD